MSGGLVSVWLADLDGTVREAQNVNQQHAPAGLVALPIVLAGYRRHERGELDLDAEAGEGAASLRELVRRALSESGRDTGREAVRLLRERVGSDEVDAVLAEAHCSPMTEITGAPAGLVTAHDVGRLLAGIGNGTLASPEACHEIERALLGQRDREGVPVGLPEDAEVANLVAVADGVRHDAALVRADGRPPFVLVALTTGLDEEDAEWRISELARFLWDSTQ